MRRQDAAKPLRAAGTPRTRPPGMAPGMAAAIIGTAVGMHVVKLHDRPKETVNRVSIAPFLSGRTGGLVLQRQF